jgi:hypothetical protein
MYFQNFSLIIITGCGDIFHRSISGSDLLTKPYLSSVKEKKPVFEGFHFYEFNNINVGETDKIVQDPQFTLELDDLKPTDFFNKPIGNFQTILDIINVKESKSQFPPLSSSVAPFFYFISSSPLSNVPSSTNGDRFLVGCGNDYLFHITLNTDNSQINNVISLLTPPPQSKTQAGSSLFPHRSPFVVTLNSNGIPMLFVAYKDQLLISAFNGNQHTSKHTSNEQSNINSVSTRVIHLNKLFPGSVEGFSAIPMIPELPKIQEWNEYSVSYSSPDSEKSGEISFTDYMMKRHTKDHFIQTGKLSKVSSKTPSTKNSSLLVSSSTSPSSSTSSSTGTPSTSSSTVATSAPSSSSSASPSNTSSSNNESVSCSYIRHFTPSSFFQSSSPTSFLSNPSSAAKMVFDSVTNEMRQRVINSERKKQALKYVLLFDIK